MMTEEILIDNIKFWVDQNIIYCKIYDGFEINSLLKDAELIFYNGISTLSKGKYMPVIINMREIDYTFSIKIYKFLSNSTLLNSIVLSKAFLVHRLGLKILLSIYNFTSDPVVPSEIFNNQNLATQHCNRDHRVFNQLKRNRS